MGRGVLQMTAAYLNPGPPSQPPPAGGRRHLPPNLPSLLCNTHTQVVHFFAHQQRLSHCGADFQPAHERPQPAPVGGRDDASTQAASPRHRERVQPDLTQRDMGVMHSSSPWVGEEQGLGGEVRGRSK